MIWEFKWVSYHLFPLSFVYLCSIKRTVTCTIQKVSADVMWEYETINAVTKEYIKQNINTFTCIALHCSVSPVMYGPRSCSVLCMPLLQMCEVKRFQVIETCPIDEKWRMATYVRKDSIKKWKRRLGQIGGRVCSQPSEKGIGWIYSTEHLSTNLGRKVIISKFIRENPKKSLKRVFKTRWK
jgi:hypothetical protein